MLHLFAYAFYFIYSSVYTLQFRHLTQNKNATVKEQIVFAFHVFCIVAALTPILLFFDPFDLHGNVLRLILLSLVTGVCGAGMTITAFVSQKNVEAGITTLAVNVYTPVTIVLSSIFLNEELTGVQIIGAVLLFLSIFLVSKKHRISRFSFDKNFLLMLCSGIFIGILVVAERALQHETGFTAGTMFSWWSQFATLGLVAFFVRAKSPYTKKELVATGMLRGLQAISFVALVFIVGNLSVVSAVTTFKVVIMFVAAAIFLKEREDLPLKILGSLIAVMGLLLMR